MIDDPPLLTVRRDFTRPDAEHLAALAGTPTGFVVDAMGGRGALAATIKPHDEAIATFVGVAITCHCGPADNLAVFGALALAGPGDVIVAATDGFAETAVIGDLVLGMARNRGAVGFVTDGMVRDQDGLDAVALPCFSIGITPNSPAKTGPGSVGLPVVLGGVAIASGDVLVADRDGVVVVPRDRLAEIIAALVRVREAEANMDAKVKGGMSLPPWAEALMASDRIRFVE